MTTDFLGVSTTGLGFAACSAAFLLALYSLNSSFFFFYIHLYLVLLLTFHDDVDLICFALLMLALLPTY